MARESDVTRESDGTKAMVRKRWRKREMARAKQGTRERADRDGPTRDRSENETARLEAAAAVP